MVLSSIKLDSNKQYQLAVQSKAICDFPGLEDHINSSVYSYSRLTAGWWAVRQARKSVDIKATAECFQVFAVTDWAIMETAIKRQCWCRIYRVFGV